MCLPEVKTGVNLSIGVTKGTVGPTHAVSLQLKLIAN